MQLIHRTINFLGSMRFSKSFTLSSIGLLCTANLLMLPAANAEGEHEVSGKAAVIASYSDAINGLNSADLSRLEGDDAFDLSSQVQLSYEYNDDNWGFYSHLQLTSEGNGKRGNVGIAEMYGYYQLEASQNASVTMTLGQLFIPSSFENTEDFWDSPYSNNFSALNTWIAQEIRPIGFELKYDWVADEDRDFSAFGFGAMSFIGNDSMGSQLTWRGWSIGRHKSVYNEVLKLPEISTIDSGMFSVQRDDGSKPFGRDLDYKYGYVVHGYYAPNADVTFNLTYLNNQGSGTLYRGEYAWDTRFVLVGAKWQVDDNWTLLGESMKGYSAMGNPPVVGVSVDYKTTYLLANYNHQQWDHSVRVEWFEGVDTTALPGESNDKGRALTLATRWQAFGKPWSIITELLYIDVDGRRMRALDNGSFIDEDESQLSLSLNYFF